MKTKEELEKAVKALKKFGIRDEAELAPTVNNEIVIAKNKKTRSVRTLGDPMLIAQSQKLYNPNLPPVKTKGPTAAQTELGTTASAGLGGNWGTPGGE